MDTSAIAIQRRRWLILGVLGSVLGLVLVVFGVVQGGDGQAWLGAGVLGPIVGGLAVLALFVWHESRVEKPSLDVRLLRNRTLSAAVGSVALLFFGMGDVYFFTSFYLQNVRGYSPLEAGALAVPFALAQFLMAPRSARLIDRYGARAVTLAGMLLNAIAIGGYALIGTSSPIVIVALLYLIQGAGLGVTVPAATASIMQALPRERAGAGSALANTAPQVAVALSVAVLGSILAQAYRSSLGPTLARLPQAARGAAGTSITATQALAQQLGPTARFLLAPASAAFVDAMRITTAIAAVIAVLGAGAVSRWTPGRPRPTAQEMEALVALEIEAAERDLSLQSSSIQSNPLELERSVASPFGAAESIEG